MTFKTPLSALSFVLATSLSSYGMAQQLGTTPQDERPGALPPAELSTPGAPQSESHGNTMRPTTPAPDAAGQSGTDAGASSYGQDNDKDKDRKKKSEQDRPGTSGASESGTDATGSPLSPTSVR